MQLLMDSNAESLVTGGFKSLNHQSLTMIRRNIDGTYQQVRKPFCLDNFNDGYTDADGRFRVYVPNHPRASNEGYVLRSIVAYETYHNVSVPKTMCIHHIDGNRLNDSKENLLMMLFGQHTSFHNEPRKKASLIPKQCKNCGKIFNINKWRLKDPHRGQFCSQSCYQTYPKSSTQKKELSESLKKAHKNKPKWRGDD